jgi:hypothetical protein
VAERLLSRSVGRHCRNGRVLVHTTALLEHRSMTKNEPAAEKRTAVDYLSFSAKTSKRVGWESWEFTVVGPHLVEVTNASYGHLKNDHQDTVGVAERDGVLVPSECDCPADVHHDEDCKHKLALASVGNDLVLRAAVNCPTTESVEAQTEDTGSVDRDDLCPSGEAGCSGPDSDELPCFGCYGHTSETEV